jgi:hypothetical protein
MDILTISPRILQAHCQSPASQRYNQSFVKELAKPTHEKLFLKNFQRFKKIKNATHNPTQTDKKGKQTMILKPNIDNGLQGRKTEHQLPTAVWRNGGLSASYDSFVVGSSAVLRLNFCAKNPPLRQAAKRYLQPPTSDNATIVYSFYVDPPFLHVDPPLVAATQLTFSANKHSALSPEL